MRPAMHKMQLGANRIEGALLRTWGEHFDILGQTSTPSEKLKVYISRGHTFNGVFEALCAISEVFVSVRGMSAKYGIVFEYRKGQKIRYPGPHHVFRLY